MERATGIELPEPALAQAYRGAVRRLLLSVDGAGVVRPTGSGEFGVAEETTLITTMSQLGLGADVAAALAGRLDEQRVDSWLRREDASMPRNIAVLHAIAEHWNGSHDATAARATFATGVRLLQWCRRRIDRGEASGSVSEVAALARTFGAMAGALDELAAAEDLASFASVLDWEASREREAAPVEAVATEPVDAVAVEAVAEWHDAETAAQAGPVADAPTGSAGPGIAGASGESDEIPPEALHSFDVLVLGPHGIDLRATLAAARDEIARGNPLGLARLRAAAELLSPGGSWPTFVHPRLRLGSGGWGDDPLVGAAFAAALRELAVSERPDNNIAVLPVFDVAWRGQNIDVRDAITSAGRLSYSVRWHGENPAILWELRHPDARLRVDRASAVPGLAIRPGCR